jgi:hypothetical protein
VGEPGAMPHRAGRSPRIRQRVTQRRIYNPRGRPQLSAGTWGSFRIMRHPNSISKYAYHPSFELNHPTEIQLAHKYTHRLKYVPLSPCPLRWFNSKHRWYAFLDTQFGCLIMRKLPHVPAESCGRPPAGRITKYYIISINILLTYIS